MFGGLILIVGNVMFVGGMQDNYICVINVINGDEFWKGCLLVGG